VGHCSQAIADPARAGAVARFVPNITNGRGWLAIVIVIAGMWRPVPILIATLAFCLLDAVQLQIQGIGIAIPYQLLLAMPYGVVILVLALSGTRSAPAMLGTPYSRE
jgi:simple sugar transport system permease protein